MSVQKNIPIALTIAGSDSGGGAGIQADLKTFAALGVHGTSVITCLTAQNPARVIGVEPSPPQMVSLQLKAVFAELPPAAVKTGMLHSAGIIRAVANWLSSSRRLPLIVDPVMISTSGARLLRPDAMRALTDKLFPLAALVTPNLHEAAALLDARLASVEDLRRAARDIHSRFGCPALVKGGHLKGLREAVDIFFDGREELILTAPFIKRVHTHGTGCTYSAAIAAHLARGFNLRQSVIHSKVFISRAIEHHHLAAGWPILNSFWRLPKR